MFSLAAVVRAVCILLNCCPSAFSFLKKLDELLHSLLVSAYVLCYQPSTHNCSHLKTALTSPITKIACTSAMETDGTRSAMISPDVIIIIVGYLPTKFYTPHISDRTIQFLRLAKFYCNERLKEGGCT